MWDLYQYGLVSFAVGHIFYIKAFGFTPFDLKKFCVAAAVGVAAYLYIIPHITGNALVFYGNLYYICYLKRSFTVSLRYYSLFTVFSSVSGMLLHILVPLYVILIFTMAWRASAGVSYLSSWQDIFGSIGAVLFVISDCTIAINLFVRTVTNSHRIIMYTYYAAQVLITLSSLPPSSPSG